jgi:hypothetical protein
VKRGASLRPAAPPAVVAVLADAVALQATPRRPRRLARATVTT